MESSFEIELSDLTDDAVRRLLKDAIRHERVNSMPAGKRAAARRAYDQEEEEEETGDNDTNVAMSRGGTKANLPNVTSADLPRGVKVAKYKGRRNGKSS
jgi:hypothetical protein